MKKKTILKVFFSVLTVFLALTCTIASIKTKKIKADTVTDLTNTTWVLNSNISFAYWVNRWYINFTSNNTNYTEFYMGDDEEMWIYYSNNQVYYRGWVNDVYKTISITGGTDVTNANLISFLQNNATQQEPTPIGTEITHQYWSLYHFAIMENNQVVGDTDIEYTILFNQYYNSTFENTEQTGLIFSGMTTNYQHSLVQCVDGSTFTDLYIGDTNYIYNTCLYEFSVGDYMDSELYEFMSEMGVWFDDIEIYIVGVDEGLIRGFDEGRATGQADGVEYTNLITNILNGLGNILNIQIFPNITLGLIIGLPLLLGVFVIIIKILRG